MRVVHSLKMDLVRPWAGNLLNMVQGDSNTRVVELQLFSDGTEWEIPPVELVTVAFKKPDKHKGFYETEYTINRNCIQVVLAPQVLTAYGKVTVVVELRNAEGSSLASFPFGIMVSQNPEVDAEASEDYFNYVNPFITEALEKVEAAAKEANEAADRAEAALTTAETAAEEAAKAASDAQEAVTNAETAVRDASSAVDRANKAADETLEAKDSFLEAAENALTEIRDVVDSGTEAPAIVSSKTGSPVVLKDSSDLLLKGLNLFGKTTQFTTTGKNLLDAQKMGVFKNKSLEVSEDGYTITCVGGSNTTYAYSEYKLPLEIARGKTLYIVYDSLSQSVNLSIMGSPISVIVTKSDGNKAYYGPTVGGVPSEFSVPIDAQDVAICVYTNNSNYTLDSDNTIVVKGLMVSFKADATYEPYTGGKPSPNPGYPQELESVGADGNVAVIVCGKNLYNANTATKYAIHEDGTLEIADRGRLTDFIPIDGDAITVSASFVEGSTNKSGYRVALYDKDRNFVLRKMITYKAVATFNDIGSYAFARVNFFTSMVDENTMQIEYGSTATEYEPYVSGGTLTAQTPNGLPGIPVSSGGNYTDENGQMWICDEIDFVRGKYVQRVNVVNLATLNPVYWYAENNYYAHTSLKAKQNTAICTHFKNGEYDDCNGGVYYFATLASRIIISNYGFGSLDNFKEFIANNDALIVCPLVETIETDLTAEQIAQYSALHTNYPNTTIYNDEGAGIGVKYVADTKLYIDNKFAELASVIVNNA